VATSELDELRRRARWLAEHPLGDSPARAEFRRALNRLRALTGQPPLVDEALEFECEVRDSLLPLEDVVVTLPPLEPAHGRPDFVVTRDGRAVAVKVIAPRGFSMRQARRAARELAEALPRYGASHAFLVVPDQVNSPAAGAELVPHVELASVGELPFVVDRALGGPA
jgi:hypothetical protein